MKFIKKGFSLIELTVVLVIMGIITATLIPLLDTKKIKIKAAQRYANEIANVINAEQNYYMNNVNQNTGLNEYTDSLDTLVNNNYLGTKPLNPFYGGENGKLKLTADNNTGNNGGTPSFTLTFNVPKDVVGVFYNTLPNIQTIAENGNRITLQIVQHIPGLKSSFDNLMHRDSGVDQELRTSHGPIQITDNVKPENSALYVTDDNTNTPENLKQHMENNLVAGAGIAKIGVVAKTGDGSLQFGVEGGSSNGKFYINSNRNDTPGTLYIGMNDQLNGKGSSLVRIGIGNTKILEVFRLANGDNYLGDGINIYHNASDGEGVQRLTAKIAHDEATKKNYLTIEDPTGNLKNTVSMYTTENGSYMEFQHDPLQKKEYFDYSNTHMPVSFIGSIAGIYEVGGNITGLPAKWIGTDCANGTGEWKYKVMGIVYWEDNTENATRTPGIKTRDDTTTNTYVYRTNVQGANVVTNVVTAVANTTQAILKDAPSTLNGLRAVLYKDGDQYKGKCYGRLTYVKDSRMYIVQDEVPCRIKVMLICVPKANRNGDYNN